MTTYNSAYIGNELIVLRLETLLAVAEILHNQIDPVVLAQQCKYIRIEHAGYRAISLADESPLLSYGKKVPKLLSTAMSHFNERKPKSVPRLTQKKMEYRRLQSWLIKNALTNDDNLRDLLCVKSNFQKLLFCSDELVITAGAKCNMLALGLRNNAYHPVLIEIESGKSPASIIKHFNRLVRTIKIHPIITAIFTAILKVCSGTSNDMYCSNEIEKILISPKKTNDQPQKLTKDVLKEERITLVEYAFEEKHETDVSKWTFSASKFH